jgi:hypothetical protein
MDAKNLAICIAPNLIRTPGEDVVRACACVSTRPVLCCERVILAY